jgi:hypothetical protein
LATRPRSRALSLDPHRIDLPFPFQFRRRLLVSCHGYRFKPMTRVKAQSSWVFEAAMPGRLRETFQMRSHDRDLDSSSQSPRGDPGDLEGHAASSFVQTRKRVIDDSVDIAAFAPAVCGSGEEIRPPQAVVLGSELRVVRSCSSRGKTRVVTAS